MTSLRFTRILTIACVALSLALLCAGVMQAQQLVNIVPNLQASPTPGSYIHAVPTTHPQAHEGTARINASRSGPHLGDGSNGHGNIRYPADLQYNGGAIVSTAFQHAIFVNPSSSCPANSCWGDPIGFLRDLSESDFIRVTDQYTGTHSHDRYPVGTNYVIHYPLTPGVPLTDHDIEIIAFSAASFAGEFGTGHMYHVFLVPGQDECFTATDGVCYSPDNFNTFAFCGYHSSFNTSHGEVLYSVEPFQNVDGCSVAPGTPNGQLADSTNNTLSHEVFETITDPNGDAWWNVLNNGIFGEEIGDECSFILFTSTAVFFDPSVVVLNGTKYAVQPEYSNKGHDCTTASD